MVKYITYYERVELVDVEFNFLRFAIDALPKAKKAKFFSDLEAATLKKLQVNMAKPPSDVIDAEEAERLMNFAQKKYKEKYAPRNRRVYSETIQDGINSSELLIRVALFESFLKDILAEAFRARPSLLAKVRPDHAVKYKQLFYELASYDKIINQQIFREVEEVDRLNFLSRAEYFEKHINLRMGDKQKLEFVYEMLNVRNEISHENPLKTVSQADLQKVRKAFLEIPAELCVKGSREFGEAHFL